MNPAGAWVCTNCGKLEHIEREVSCWTCGTGEMVYCLSLADVRDDALEAAAKEAEAQAQHSIIYLPGFIQRGKAARQACLRVAARIRGFKSQPL